MTEQPNSSERIAEFQDLVLDYIYQDGLPLNLRARLAETEEASPVCARLAAELREARDSLQRLPERSPPPLSLAVLEAARAVAAQSALESAQPALQGASRASENRLNDTASERPRRLFTNLVEPIGWAAAASLLLACGYVLGLATSIPPGSATPHYGSDASSSRLTADAAALFGHIARSERSLELEHRPETWSGLRKLQSALAQSESSLERHLQSGDSSELSYARAGLERARRLVDAGARLDGPLALDEAYKLRLSELERRFRELDSKK